MNKHLSRLTSSIACSVLSFMVVFALSGCGGSRSSIEETTGEATAVNPAGIWLGSQTIVGVGAFDMKTIIYDSRMLGISEDAGVMFAGTYEMEEGKYIVSDGQENSATSYKLYDLYDNNNSFAIGMVSAKVNERSSFKGSYANSAKQEGQVFSYYSKLYEKAVSIDDIQGNWATSRLNTYIDSDGSMTGVLDDCVINGNLFAPLTDRNIFEVDITLSECDKAGKYAGLGIIMQDETNGTYFLALTANSDRMENFGFTLSNSQESLTPVDQNKTAAVRALAKNVTALERWLYPVETDTVTGENHDGEDFTGQDINYNITNSSYRNGIFTRANFTFRDNIYRYDTYPITITNSDFSGSTFTETRFAGTYNKPTTIENSDFSYTSFTYVPLYGTRLYISASGSDFTGSTFKRQAMTLDAESNTLTDTTFLQSYVKIPAGDIEGITLSHSRFNSDSGDLIDIKKIDNSTLILVDGSITGNAFIIQDSDVTLNKGSIENATFKKSNLKLGEENSILKNIVFDHSELTLDKKFIFNNVTFTEGSGLVIDVDLDTLASMLDIQEFIRNSPEMLEIKIRTDMPDKDLTGVNLILNGTESENRPLLFLFDRYVGLYKNGDFSGSNFTDGSISIRPYLLDDTPKNYKGYNTLAQTYVYKTDFSGANFTNTSFKTINESYGNELPFGFEECNFHAANFTDTDPGTAYMADSDFTYVNFGSADILGLTRYNLNDLSNAWYGNGSRCAPGSVISCIPLPDMLNTGLTYEEYINGKDDLDRFTENIKNEAKDLADEGIGFVKDTGSKASNVAKDFFGW